MRWQLPAQATYAGPVAALEKLGATIMRSIVGLFAGIGLLSFTSCSEISQGSRVADNTPASKQPESHGPSGRGVHGQFDSEPEGSSETGDEHAGDRITHADHQGEEQSTTSGHDGHGQSHRRSQWRHGAHGHGHDGGHSGGQHAGANVKHIAVGDIVPDFEITIDGKKFKLTALQENKTLTEDGTLVLTFWCSFCHSCRDVEHRLDELARQYKGKVGVIALDASMGETAEDVSEFAEENKLTMPIALNTSGTAADIFGARVTTTTVVIDSRGVLRYCGQFGDKQHSFAADALQAVLAGEEVHVKKTRHKG